MSPCLTAKILQNFAFLFADNSFVEVLKSQGLQLHNVPADGNCQFESIAFHLRQRGMTTSAAEVRKQVVEYICKNPGLVSRPKHIYCREYNCAIMINSILPGSQISELNLDIRPGIHGSLIS